MRDIDKYAQDYVKHDFEEKQVFYRRKKLLEIIHTYPHKRILEIGCGLEPLFQYVPEFEDFTVVEPSDLFFQHAVSLAKNDSRITCVHDFFCKKLALPAGGYDFIICSSLLHELDDPKEIIEKAYEIADDQTVFHINVPNARSLHRILALESGMIKSLYQVSDRGKLYQQAGVFDLDSLKQIVESAGFRVIESGSYFVKPFTHKQMGKLLDEQIIDERVLEGFYGLADYLPDYGSEIYVNVKKGNA